MYASASRIRTQLFTLIIFFALKSYAFEEPAYIFVSKPLPETIKVIDIAGNGDYQSFEEADQDHGQLTPPVNYLVKEGTYEGVIEWNSSGNSGQEIVFEPHPDNTQPVRITNNGGETTTLSIRGSHIIFDGGQERNIIVDGSAKPTGDHYLVRLNDQSKHHITFSRIQLINALGTNTAKCVVPETDNLRIFNCVLDTSSSVGIYIQNGNHIEIRNNIVRNCQGTGIQANPHTGDASVDELHIAGNIVYNNGSGGPMGERPGIALLSNSNGLYDVYVYNNVVWGNQTAGIKKENGVSNANIRIYNNTIYDNIAHGFWFKDTGTIDIKNNIVYGNGSDAWSNWIPQYFGPDDSVSSNNITSNPSFSSTEMNSDNYLELSNNSPAKDAGTSALEMNIESDISGNLRLQGSNIDLGAYEFVNGPTPPVITTSELPNGTVNDAYSTNLSASGGTFPYSWKLKSGNLPSGLVLNSIGSISGTPSNEETESFILEITDKNGLTATKQFSIEIGPELAGNSEEESPDTITIAWDPTTDEESGIDYYQIYRDDIMIGSSNTNSFTDTGLLPGVTYSYRISAVNRAGGESEKSEPFSITTKESGNPVVHPIISSPANGFTVTVENYESFTIAGKSGVSSSVEIFANGNVSLGLQQADENGSWLGVFSLAPVAEGPVSLTARATSLTSSPVVGIYDTSPPTNPGIPIVQGN